MKRHIFVLVPLLLFVATVAAEVGISAKQIITTCVQKGDVPCAVGVDKRTITVNNVTYNVSIDVLRELETFYENNQQVLSAEEKKRYGILRDSLQRMEKIG